MAPLFETTDLSFSYGSYGKVAQNDLRIIDGISISLDGGRFYGVIGPNGCGKTTLLDLLMGQARPLSGRVCFSGRELSTYRPKELARQMALVPQIYSINFPFTVQEVVAMGRYPHLPRFSSPGDSDRAIIDKIMQLTDIESFAHRRINQLSGGERQRVVFARALAQQTPVLFLDEATANLDINHALALLTLAAKRIEAGGTVISVFQEINLAAMFCDHLIFMQGGRVMTHGPTREVLTETHLKELFDVDCRVIENPFNHHLQVAYKV